jgi:hypothetical protein
MQNQKKKTFDDFCYLSHVSKMMEKIVGMLMQTPKNLNGKKKNKSIGGKP